MKRRRPKPHVGVQPGTLAFAVILALGSVGCSAAPAPPEEEDPSPSTAAEIGAGTAAPVIAAIPPERRARLWQPSHADWEEILETRVHRDLVVERRVGREPIRYVGNIYKYYIAHGLLEEQEAVRRRAISETVPDEG